MFPGRRRGVRCRIPHGACPGNVHRITIVDDAGAENARCGVANSGNHGNARLQTARGGRFLPKAPHDAGRFPDLRQHLHGHLQQAAYLSRTIARRRPGRKDSSVVRSMNASSGCRPISFPMMKPARLTTFLTRLKISGCSFDPIGDLCTVDGDRARLLDNSGAVARQCRVRYGLKLLLIGGSNGMTGCHESPTPTNPAHLAVDSNHLHAVPKAAVVNHITNKGYDGVIDRHNVDGLQFAVCERGDSPPKKAAGAGARHRCPALAPCSRHLCSTQDSDSPSSRHPAHEIVAQSLAKSLMLLTPSDRFL